PPGAPSRIPIVSVTGTNGKTTTTRLLAHIARYAGHHVGLTTTEAVYVGSELIIKGDCTGPASAQAVLRDPTVTFAALETARGGPVEEGNVGAGTGTIAFGFKGGIGTASRALPAALGGYTVGVLVQSNYGGVLTIAGAPVGRALGRHYLRDELAGAPPRAGVAGAPDRDRADGSIILVVATDAPLDARNLERLASRALLGLARTGSAASNGSGDYAIAFSTFGGNRIRATEGPRQTTTLGNESASPLFLAAIEAAEEAIYNSLFRAKTMTGREGHTVEALPLAETLAILRRHDVLQR
ncbi:MAG TPA: P1 family peptidase, partial [Gemmatimonadales bacterium]|nr:P1 family peptidase [Gemmatimonadales bacterium]